MVIVNQEEKDMNIDTSKNDKGVNSYVLEDHDVKNTEENSSKLLEDDDEEEDAEEVHDDDVKAEEIDDTKVKHNLPMMPHFGGECKTTELCEHCEVQVA